MEADSKDLPLAGERVRGEEVPLRPLLPCLAPRRANKEAYPRTNQKRMALGESLLRHFQ